MHLYFTQDHGWELPDGSKVTRKDLTKVGLREGMPFFIDDAGEYVHDINRWLRDLPTSGARSPNTWKSYARDALLFLRFLKKLRPGSHWTATTRADLQRYHLARRGDPTSRYHCTEATWNRSLAALERLFAWAVENNLIEVTPFQYRLRATFFAERDAGGLAVRRSNLLREATRRHAPRYLTADEYTFWRDVGLRGLLPDGRPDSAFKGRNGARNALFADLLATTGMRRSEGASLLIWDALSDLVGAQREVEIMLPGEISKNRDPRRVFVPLSVYRRLRDYMRAAREVALAAGLNDEGAYVTNDAALLVTYEGHGAISVVGRSKRQEIAAFRVEDRARFVVRDGSQPAGPAQIFVGERGAAMLPTAWNRVFEAANARVAQFSDALSGLRRGGGEEGIVVHPHDLRHTFAVNFLSHLYRRMNQESRDALHTAAGQLRRRILMDPLRILQLRLGHRSIESTFTYVQYLDELQDIAHDAAEQWAIDLDLAYEGGHVA